MQKEDVKRNTLYVIIVLVLAAILILTVFLFFWLNGETKTTGQIELSESNDLVVCTNINFDYPFFVNDNTISKETTIKMVFKNDNLSSIYLNQQMFYNNASDASASSAVNHANMNKSFGSTYGADAFNATYFVDGTKMRMTLYAEARQLDEDSGKYFLITTIANKKKDLTDNYKTQNFTCINNN